MENSKRQISFIFLLSVHCESHTGYSLKCYVLTNSTGFKFCVSRAAKCTCRKMLKIRTVSIVGVCTFDKNQDAGVSHLHWFTNILFIKLITKKSLDF